MGCKKSILIPLAIAVLSTPAVPQNPAQQIDSFLHPFTSREEIEVFLRTAKIVGITGYPEGVTNPKRLGLDDGTVQHDALYKNIDVRKSGVYKMGSVFEFDFKDSWKFEVAAYEIDKLLSLNMIPVTVERKYQGVTGSLQYWINDCISEEERRLEERQPPSIVRWNWQMYKVWVFDKLIYNIDRNLKNLLVAPEWKCVMIDHSRSFKSLDKVEALNKLKYFSRSLMEGVEQLDEAEVRERCGRWLTDSEISTMMKRRDILVDYYHELLQENGKSILYP
jgi:hypothetical protein